MILDRSSVTEWLEVIKADGQTGQEAFAHCERLCRLIDPSRENHIPLRHAAPASYPDDSSTTAMEAFEAWRHRINELIAEAGGQFRLEVTNHDDVPFNQVLCWFEGEGLPETASSPSSPKSEVKTQKPLPPNNVQSSSAPKTSPAASTKGAMQHLTEWLSDEDKSPVFLLLGEYGSGKSTLCRDMSERLSRGDFDYEAVYLDLKQARQLFYSETSSLRSRRFRADDIRLLIDTLAEIDGYTSEEVYAKINAGNCVLICDGLDEIGAALHPDETSSLFQALVAFLSIGAARSTSNRLLVSCRSHHFRNKRQIAALLGNMKNVSAPEIMSMDLLEPEDLRGTLIELTSDAERAQQTLEALNGLAVMARRPSWLHAIAQRLEALDEERRSAGSVNLARLFDDLIDDALATEENRQVFDSDIKKQLMVTLAGDMWDSGRAAWSASELNAWLDAQLRTDERMNDIYASSYKGKARELLYVDLRTTTFLVRGQDDLFRFSDSPIRAFFLAAHLFKSTGEGRFDAWEANETDHDVQIFITDLIFNKATQKERKAFLQSIGKILSEPYKPMSSDLAFGIALQAQERGDPDAPKGGFQMPGVDLSHLGKKSRLSGYDFAGSNFAGAILSNAHIANASFRECDLQGARFENCRFDDVNFTSAKLDKATISDCTFRNCELTDADLQEATCTQNLVVHCDGLEKESRTALIAGGNSVAPATAAEWRRINVRREHLARRPQADRNITTCVYSPDGKLVLSACDDGAMHIWNSETGIEHVALKGHAAAVRSCAFSPDGRLVASCSDDATIRLWDAGSGKEKTVFRGHTLAVTCCAFNKTGSLLVTGSQDTLLKVWDCKSGKLIHTLAGHDDAITDCDINAADAIIISASADRTLRFWDAASGEECFPAGEHEAAVMECAFSSSGGRVVTSSKDNLLHLWDGATGKAIAILPDHEDSITRVAFAPGGKSIVSASKDSTIRVWDADSGEIAKVVTDHSSSVTWLDFSNDGNTAITSTQDGMLRLWDTKTWRSVSAFPRQESIILGCSISADGHHIISWSDAGVMCVWDAASNPELACLEGHVDWIHACTFSPDGTRIASAARDNTLRLWNAEDGSMIAVLGGHDNWVQCLDFSPDGTRIISGSDDNSLRLWDGATGDPIARLEGHGGSVNICAYSADGSRILSGSDDGTLRLWHGTTGHQIAVLQGHSNWVRAGAFSEDGKRIVSGSYNNGLRIWNGETGKQIATLKGHSDSITRCKFSRDRKKIVSGSNDRSVRIWDTKSATELLVLEGHEAAITACCFSPDGQLVLSASEDSTLRVWNAESGELAYVLSGHEGIVSDCSFSPDGGRIISCCDDRTLKIWDTRSGTMITTLRGHTGFVKVCAFSPDGARIASGSYDNTLRVWDGNAGCEIANCHHVPDGGHLTFSRSDDLVLSASANAWRHFEWRLSEGASNPAVMPLEADPEIGMISDEGFHRT
ncbi:pentapeptide repeat-containing protein [Hoeflea sp. CAU 1731]